MPFGFSLYRRRSSKPARKLSTAKSFDERDTASSADDIPLAESGARIPTPAPWRRNSDPHNLRLLAANANDIQLVSMSRPVTLTFTSPGAKPPIYVAGSFTRPPWTAIEMDQAEDAPNGDPVFIKTFDDVETGEYQYKYRLGNGDWWMLNEKVETGECHFSSLVMA
ncbi:hypothetical protein EJ05DRAFT_472233 [Pseudovirgaria hyperparasitica]|uniref:AMP-activated protein kinase glycogen-binding domain-containing protein n=1 Tax=Pseudovirgaria hyperparasitica TaxID=470096 RepID=A0A6A6WM90_9PEZI|nr:uncharacterized protein EJ05DRAFT_472233 [Pseudovirgaria hyperparasitica]KAF2763321.1 hypothetical protein EJ05DRAFT_472233 [Pseudovirgaria hyperparasitica]